MDISEIQQEVKRINVEKGWYDKPVSFGEGIALIHSEASEALEAYRNLPESITWRDEPELLDKAALELADIVIRTLDLAERNGIDLAYFIEEKIVFNQTRPYRHGGKRL